MKKILKYGLLSLMFSFLFGSGEVLASDHIELETVSRQCVLKEMPSQAGWRQDAVGWWYQEEEGSYPSSCWKLINDEWYYFNASGYMVTGWLNLGSVWYYLHPVSGAMISSAWLDDTYYLDASGAMATGWYLLDGEYYYFSPSGAKVTDAWIGNYYVKSNGVMATSEWVGDYYVDQSGAYVAISGWYYLNGEYYYLVNGARYKGWLSEGNVWYYLDVETGRMYSAEWLDNTYYLQNSGEMATGWIMFGGEYYYLTASGVKATNTWIGNYYVKADGVMATDEWIDGIYYVDENGLWIPGYDPIKGELDTLKAYITQNGFLNDDGNYFISMSEVLDGVECTAGIVYNMKLDELQFVLVAEDYSMISTIAIQSDSFDNQNLSTQFAFVTEFDGFVAYANIDTATYTGTEDVYFTIDETSGIEEADIQELGNALLQVGFSGWDYLANVAGTSMNGIGFTAYVAS